MSERDKFYNPKPGSKEKEKPSIENTKSFDNINVNIQSIS